MRLPINSFFFFLFLLSNTIIQALQVRPIPTINPNPIPANPNSITYWGNARFTILTPRLVRLELAGQSGVFDDRATLAVISRLGDTPSPSFSVVTNGTKLTITTDQLTLVYNPPDGNTTRPGVSSMCQLAKVGYDIADGVRVPSYPNGANTTSQSQCCQLCDFDIDCSTWVYATSPMYTSLPNKKKLHSKIRSSSRNINKDIDDEIIMSSSTTGVNCWLMMDVTSLTPSSNRVTGAILPFSSSELSINFSVVNKSVSWNPSVVDSNNLLGSFHALDCYDVPSNCIESYDSSMLPGLVSRSGFAILDDTFSARIVNPNSAYSSPIPFWYTNATARTQPAADLYFFAHGHDYRSALFDYSLIGGPPSLPPSSTMGVWWSHWQPFNQTFFETDILQNYKLYNLPLNHVMLDVDWHTEESSVPGNSSVACYDYGGYTVNTNLWPHWSTFIASLKDGSNPSGYANLRLMLNLHPQGGTDACQKNWSAFQTLINYTGSEIVPCTFGNQQIASASFEAFMDAIDLQDVDGFWTDFDYIGDCFDAPTSSTTSSFPGIAWSNEVFGQHQRTRARRPLVLARSGGLGAHRNPVSFSGDANQHQDILKWEIANTPLAANILFNTWSHDIGGFMCQSIPQANCSGDPTQLSNGLLYLRWLQAGVTFPILRTHASTWGLAVMERRVWHFPEIISSHMMNALRLRSALQPYIYSEARNAYDTAVATVHPLFYDYPEAEEAYNYNLTGGPEFLFGSVPILASSIYDVDATYVGPDGVLGSTRTSWIPPGSWCNWNGTKSFLGPLLTDPIFYTLGDYPLFVPQGSIIPMKTNASISDVFVDPLVLTVFPSLIGSTESTYTLYEDDGDSNDFEQGAFSQTVLSSSFSVLSPIGHTITINEAQGNGFKGQKSDRLIIIHLRGFMTESNGSLPSSVTFNKNPILPGTRGCGNCFYLIDEANHSPILPSGTLVVEAGRASINTVAQVVINM
jgi:alpha-glucosidase (family GH31 glycosyl hydrolase)